MNRPSTTTRSHDVHQKSSLVLRSMALSFSRAKARTFKLVEGVFFLSRFYDCAGGSRTDDPIPKPISISVCTVDVTLSSRVSSVAPFTTDCILRRIEAPRFFVGALVFKCSVECYTGVADAWLLGDLGGNSVSVFPQICWALLMDLVRYT